jgi:hypothetical protein
MPMLIYENRYLFIKAYSFVNHDNPASVSGVGKYTILQKYLHMNIHIYTLSIYNLLFTHKMPRRMGYV